MNHIKGCTSNPCICGEPGYASDKPVNGERPSLRCFETRPRCMECPCMKCGLAFDVSVYHHGKDAPAVLGEVTKHYYDHPSVQVVHLLDKAKAEARRKAFKLAADEMEKWASELPLDGCEGAPEGLDQHSFSRGTVEMGKLLQREANEFAARLRAMGESQ